MDDIETIFSKKDVITEEARAYKAYIENTWGNLFRVELEIPLKELFPKPTNTGLNHIWKYGSADVVVYRGDKLVAIFEPGGSHHLNDEKQMKNDRRKWMLCKKNGIPCTFIMNGVAFNLSNRKQRQLFGKTLFFESL